MPVPHGNMFMPLFNVLGILAAGVLGALYAMSQKEKTATKSTIESVNHLKACNRYSYFFSLFFIMVSASI